MDAVDGLLRHIDRAIEQLRTSRAADDEGLLFIGAWHDAYPTILVRDPFLTDSAKVQLLYLTQEARRQPNGAIAMPSIEETAQALRHSRGTVIRDRTLLRICRWVSLVRRLRDARSGRFDGAVLVMHGEPAQLVDAVRIDDGYLRLLEEAAADHRDPATRRAARAALLGIDRDVAAGEDPLKRRDPYGARTEAVRAVSRRDGIFFGIALSDADQVQNPDPDPSSNFEPGEKRPGSNFELGENPGPKFVLGSQVVDFIKSPKFGPGVCSSSINTTTTTEPPDSSACARATPPGLHWPPGFDDNTRRLILRTLNQRQIPAEHHQDLIDALAHKALDRDDPLRNPVGYTRALCDRYGRGEFNPVGPPQAQPGAVALTAVQGAHSRRAASKRRLQGDITAVRQLLAGANGPAREALERQLRELERRVEAGEG